MIARLLAVFTLTLVFTSQSTAQDAYPSKVIRIIVPTQPGASPDILARSVAHHLAPRLGQQILILNQPGGGGNIGHGNAAKAAHDGYMLLLTTDALSINDTLFGNLPFRSSDFVPVIQLVDAAQVLVVNPKFEAKNVAELVAYAKANPGKVNFASPQLGTAGHLTGELMKMQEKLDMVHIPFPGAPVALKEVMASNIHMLWVTLPAAMGQIRQGLVRAIAVTTERRVGAVPDVPTMTELGYKGYGFGSWQGIFLPPGSAKAIADRLNGEINAVLRLPQVVDSLTKVGFDPIGGTPELFGKTVAETSARWGNVVREAGVKPH